MTNQEIIINEAVVLAEQGKIGKTGKKIIVSTAFGPELVDEPVAIHTYSVWKTMGFQVKKGEKAVAKFKIWKPFKAKLTESEDENNETETSEDVEVLKMGKVNAAFFSIEQVEKIA